MLLFCTDLFLFGRVPLLPEPQKNTDSSIEGSTVSRRGHTYKMPGPVDDF